MSNQSRWPKEDLFNDFFFFGTLIKLGVNYDSNVKNDTLRT